MNELVRKAIQYFYINGDVNEYILRFENKIEFIDLFQEVEHKEGKCVIVVTHSQEVVKNQIEHFI